MTISHRIKVTFLSSFILGGLAHLFTLTNVLQNYDNIAIVPGGYGTGLTSGRWLLTVLGNFIKKIWGNYNLPFFNGLLTIFLLCISACLIVEILDLESISMCIVWGGIFLCFPTVTSTLFFMYTAPYYALAVLFVIASVWFTVNYKYGFLLAAVLGAFSLGIYQAYFPMMITLFVTVLLQKILSNDSQLKDIFRIGLLYLLTLFLSLLLYFLFLNICLKFYNMSLSDYQGVNEMGTINFMELPQIIKRMYIAFIKIPLADYKGLSATPIIRLSLSVLGAISIFIISYIVLVRVKDWRIKISAILLCLIFPIAVNSIIFMCPHSNIYTLMIYAAVFIYMIPLMLLDLMEKLSFICVSTKYTSWLRGIRKIILITYSVVIFNYIWLSNGNYVSMYYTTQQTNNYLNSLITQARVADGYHSSLKWAFIGDSIVDPLFDNPWTHFDTFSYGGNATTLINAYSRNSFIKNYVGYQIPIVDDEIINKLKTDKHIMEMPCYPDSGSIEVYKGVLVIKFANEE